MAKKVAVVTGAASGIGRGLAEHTAGLGMKLVLADINGEALESVAQSLDTEVLIVVADVSDVDAVEHLAEEAYARFGRVDLLFNNAGIMAAGFSWEIDPQQFQRALDININGVINGARAFVPRMKEQGERAFIVNTASIGGLLASPLMAPYSVSKFAVVAFSESLHAEMALLQLPIQVSVLCPGPVTSEIFKSPSDAAVTIRRSADSCSSCSSTWTPMAFPRRNWPGAPLPA
ncbi:SDR family oxidoreductase [Microbulbifer taiwanensis]|uniref:SDR family oxidoreductase n=1 Tax=Microbulbifer taiwanensis TaxID=986746 RepID=UPI003619999B